MRKLLTAAGVAWCLALPVQAQDTPPPSDTGPDVEVGDVVVERTVRDIAREFVVDAMRAPRGNNLARYHDTICIGVVNLDRAHAQYLVDQVSAVAMAVGLDVDEPGCTPRILILADSDGDRLAQWLVDQSPLSFRPNIYGSNLGRNALSEFQSSGAPVRWWHVTTAIETATGRPVPPGGQVRASDVPRIRSPIEQGFTHTIIILDTSRIGSINFASLADYISMIALSEVDRDADMGAYDSVLNLFTQASLPGAQQERMTDWDLDILRGLYSARGNGAQRARQVREIGYEIEREREQRQEAQADEDDAAEG